jgi:hypothetical protein
MKIDPTPLLPQSAVFLQTVSHAVARLKQRLQQDYAKTYPQLREVIRLVLDEEEKNAWKLSLFPHLILPDLVQEHIATLNLRPARTKHEDVFARHQSHQISSLSPAVALCG